MLQYNPLINHIVIVVKGVVKKYFCTKPTDYQESKLVIQEYNIIATGTHEQRNVILFMVPKCMKIWHTKVWHKVILPSDDDIFDL